MKREDKFFLVVLATVLLLRLVIAFIPSSSAIFSDYHHHVYTGVLLVFVFAVYNYELHHKLFYPFAVAIGFIIDELIYLLPFFTDDIVKGDYFGFYSFLFLAFGLVVVFVMRKMFVREILVTQS
tara:strand:+ start:513 stop:884 length:372 start_codon:yes stop_codon:yes gene_type:complete